MPAVKSIAFDLSLNSTGVCLPDGTTRTIRGLNTKHTEQQRLVYLFHAFQEVLKEQKVQRIYKEGTFIRHGRMSGQTTLIQVHGLLVCAADVVFDGSVGIWTVSPTELKRFATGKGNAKKDEMIAAAKERFGYDGKSDDEADALLIQKYFQSLEK